MDKHPGCDIFAGLLGETNHSLVSLGVALQIYIFTILRRRGFNNINKNKKRTLRDIFGSSATFFHSKNIKRV